MSNMLMLLRRLFLCQECTKFGGKLVRFLVFCMSVVCGNSDFFWRIPQCFEQSQKRVGPFGLLAVAIM